MQVPWNMGHMTRTEAQVVCVCLDPCSQVVGIPIDNVDS